MRISAWQAAMGMGAGACASALIAQPRPDASPSTSPSTTAASTQSSTRPGAVATWIRAHDPAVVQEGNLYHLFASNGGIGHWSSPDLVHWTRVGRIFEQTPAWALREIGGRPGLWAPDAAWFGGQWHVFYSASTMGSQRSAIAQLTTPSLANPVWTDAGKVIESHPGMSYNTIDPGPFVDGDGHPWLVFGSYWRGIFLTRLDPQTGIADPAFTPVRLATRAEVRGGTRAIEASYLFQHDGWYFLLAAWDQCCKGLDSTYKIMVGRSRDIAGPYLDFGRKRLDQGAGTLLLAGHGDTIGPGHASIIRRGGQLLMAHHYYDPHHAGAPSVQARPLFWDADGWPVAGEPLREQQPEVGFLAGEWQGLLDYRRPVRLFLNQDGGGTLGAEALRWQERDKQVQLTVGDQTFTLARGDGALVGREPDGTILRAIQR